VCQAISFFFRLKENIPPSINDILVASGSGPFSKGGSNHIKKKDSGLKSAKLVVMGYEPFAHTYPTVHISLVL
jgi:hypothetical protein